MRTFSFAVAAVLGTLCFSQCAHAQWEVQDAVTEGNTSLIPTISTTASAISTTADTISSTDTGIHNDTTATARSTADTLTMFKDVPDVTNEFQDDDATTVQNAMPDSGINPSGTSSSTTVASALSFQNPGIVDGSSTFYGQNNTGSPGTDPVLVAQDTIQKVSANIQAMAAANLNALKQRLNLLNEMSQALSSASDITHVTAINGRIAVEGIAVQAEQAQAANLVALATAQAEINRENEAQAMRQEHTKTSSLFAALEVAPQLQQ